MSPTAQCQQDQGAGGALLTKQEATDTTVRWWSVLTTLMHSTGSMLFFLRRLGTFSVCTRLCQIFYLLVAASGSFFTPLCWRGSIKAGDVIRANNLVEKASSVVCLCLDSLGVTTERRIRARVNSILENPSHPLYNGLRQLKTQLMPLRCWKAFLYAGGHQAVLQPL